MVNQSSSLFLKIQFTFSLKDGPSVDESGSQRVKLARLRGKGAAASGYDEKRNVLLIKLFQFIDLRISEITQQQAMLVDFTLFNQFYVICCSSCRQRRSRCPGTSLRPTLPGE